MSAAKTNPRSPLPMRAEDPARIDDCDLLILGASFTGIEVMHQLKRMGTLETIDTVVVDAQVEHAYVPLVHEVVAGGQDERAYIVPTRDYVSSLPRARYVQDAVVSLDANGRVVRLASGRGLRARAIVIALGSRLQPAQTLTTTTKLWSAKFLAESLALRQRLQTTPPGRIVVIGGGITGVEMAGELAIWAKQQSAAFSIALVHADPQLLTQSCAAAGPLALRLLQGLGVEVLLGTRVESLDDARLVLSQSGASAGVRESQLRMDCVLAIWAGGIHPALVSSELDVYRAADGWIEVDPWLRCTTATYDILPGIFAGGDAVRVRDDGGRWPTMQRAIECIWQGKVLARNVSAYLGSSAAPGLTCHRLKRDFPYGISIGCHSLVMYKSWCFNFGALGVAFRRWLMRRYFARYAPSRPVALKRG